MILIYLYGLLIRIPRTLLFWTQDATLCHQIEIPKSCRKNVNARFCSILSSLSFCGCRLYRLDWGHALPWWETSVLAYNFDSLKSTYIMQVSHMKTKPMKYKIDFMKAKTSAFLSDSRESINFERVVSTERDCIREVLSQSVELFSFFFSEKQSYRKDFTQFSRVQKMFNLMSQIRWEECHR